ncbi:MAG: DNA-directed RNA polymerase subunit beta' [Lentimicrobiaceae bacterium]|nr:DNA-directed RNA polymerase subunit beta' [Lentimicrobiaceae bacterium]
MAFRKDNTTQYDFNSIRIKLASPESILKRSFGEVTKPETINYRTYKPERDGLFCERIFGPVKDWECHCGKYKRIRYKGITCDRCGVEVTEKKVRRERMGHVQLMVPVAHIWYFRSLPNKMALLLGIKPKRLESIVYYENYVVIQPGVFEAEGLKTLDFIDEQTYFEYIDRLPKDNQYLEDSDPNKFIAKMGGEALHDLLSRIDLDKESYELRDKANNETSQQRKQDALKRLQVIESFRESQQGRENRPEWMLVKVVPVIPPDLRPLVPLDGGRFATSDLNDLYRRVIIRNNRLKRLIEIKAPDVIMRNEKRMLQEAVDSLFDNSRKTSSVKTDSNRPLKSLSDSLKGKQGRFRQNLLGKRVDYSGRSVIVVGPQLKLHECGLPKDMAAELYKPFIIRKMLERGIVKTVKTAKKIVDKKSPVVWEILENIMKGHPVLLNRAPTLHRLGIQAFQPKLIEGKAIQLHPLVCTAFNADFDGDQMAVHLPLGNAAILEAQMLMLSSHNILNPANGAPITVPSQDMVLGLYYMTKSRASIPEKPVKGENKVFYSPKEVIIAHNEGAVDLHAVIKVKILDVETQKENLIETTVGRVIFNQVVPEEFGYINELLTKKSLRSIIGDMLKKTGTAKTAQFLDDIKDLGFKMAFEGGLSFNIGDIIIPEAKAKMIEGANEKVDEIEESYKIGIITHNERTNQIIDEWTHVNNRLAVTVLRELSESNQGFNSAYMMLDSGARGSGEQIRQLAGMRGLMAKPQKSGSVGNEIIENPILSNFKEGLSVLEYFISTHGARKGLADTALKTADAGYLTRRLVDVAQDVVITEEDCGTLRGLTISALKKNEEVVESLYDRILGRVTLHDIYHPNTGELIVAANTELDEKICQIIENSPIESVEIRSVLTCESKHGVCTYCYGRNLATGRMVQKGEAVGVIAAQSIGEPGTQLTLRTFHMGGVAGGNIASNYSVTAKYDGIIEIDELKSVPKIKSDDEDPKDYNIVISRFSEMRIVDPKTNISIHSAHIPYSAHLYFKPGDAVKKGDLIADWDPYNALILSDINGKAIFENVIEGVTVKIEHDEQTGFQDRIIIDSKIRANNPCIKIVDEIGEVIKTFDLPVGAHLQVEENAKIVPGTVLVKIPRSFGKSTDITGGLPRVTELFEARNPSDEAKVSAIDGVVSFGPKLKRGNREVIVTSKSGTESYSYLIPTTKQILVQEHDYVKAGTPLSVGAITPADILAIQGPMKVQEHIVNEAQEVYRLQQVKINDKHFEVIVRQMMRKVEVIDAGDTKFLEKDVVNKIDFNDENDAIFGMKVVEDAGDSDLSPGQLISSRKLRDENSALKRKDKKLVVARDAKPATAQQILQGITRASLQVSSWLSAASFQETTKVLTQAAIEAKSDDLMGLKENVIIGKRIPAGTGLKEYKNLIVGSKEEYETLMANK